MGWFYFLTLILDYNLYLGFRSNYSHSPKFRSKTKVADKKKESKPYKCFIIQDPRKIENCNKTKGKNSFGINQKF